VKGGKLLLSDILHCVVCRVSPRRCGAQWKTWAWGPM